MKQYTITRKDSIMNCETERSYDERWIELAAEIIGIPKRDVLKLAMKNAKKIEVKEMSVENLLRADRKQRAIIEYVRENKVSLIEAKDAINKMEEAIKAEQQEKDKEETFDRKSCYERHLKEELWETPLGAGGIGISRAEGLAEAATRKDELQWYKEHSMPT